MSRAVIDQSGFKVVFVGLLFSLLLGFALKAQISTPKIQTLLQESISRLDKDFIIDFQSAEVILSKWGLPLPFLQISQIRLSPRKTICQDSQIYIEELILPLSPVALLTTRTLVTEISATNIELRISDLENCFSAKAKSLEKPPVNSGPVLLSKSTVQAAEQVPNIFKVRTAGLLQKFKIEQLKLIYKKYPAQPVNFKQIQLDFSYNEKKLDKVQFSSQVYALKDPLSDLMFFKGELNFQVTAKSADNIETEAELRGRLLDGEIQAYTIYNSLQQNLKVDFEVRSVALKPFIQLNLIESAWMNYPVTLQLHGYGQYQLDGSHMTLLKLNDINIAGEKTQIKIHEINLKKENERLVVDAFSADIHKLNLNKLASLNQIRHISQSIENFGEINGVLNFTNKDHIQLQGEWSDLEFIFSNRGRREVQRLDSFHIQAQKLQDLINLKMSKFRINEKDIEGKADIWYNEKNANMQAEAGFDGPLLSAKIWELLSQKNQMPNIKLNWNFRKAVDEKHQLNIAVDEFALEGIKFNNTSVNLIQNSQNGTSFSLAVAAKVGTIQLLLPEVKLKPVTQIFSLSPFLKEESYSSDPLFINLKGSDWRNMSYDFETHLKGPSDLKYLNVLKGRGDWKDDDSASGTISMQNQNQILRFEIVKKDNNSFEIQPR